MRAKNKKSRYSTSCRTVRFCSSHIMASYSVCKSITVQTHAKMYVLNNTHRIVFTEHIQELI